MLNKLPDKKQKLYLDFIKKNNRIMDRDESFDFYTEHVMTTSCQIYDTYKGKQTADYALWQIELKAYTWHRGFIGGLVINGFLTINVEEMING